MAAAEATRKLIVLIEDRPEDTLLFVKVTSELLPVVKVEVFENDLLFEAWLKKSTDVLLTQVSMIFLDINLRAKGGFYCLSLIKKHKILRLVPSLFLTTSSQQSEIERAYREGIQSYIVKPMEIQDFRRMLGLTYDYWFEIVSMPQLF